MSVSSNMLTWKGKSALYGNRVQSVTIYFQSNIVSECHKVIASYRVQGAKQTGQYSFSQFHDSVVEWMVWTQKVPALIPGLCLHRIGDAGRATASWSGLAKTSGLSSLLCFIIQGPSRIWLEPFSHTLTSVECFLCFVYFSACISRGASTGLQTRVKPLSAMPKPNWLNCRKPFTIPGRTWLTWWRSIKSWWMSSWPWI